MTLAERIDAYEKLIRLDKPIGILLLLWPTLWALWMSSRGNPNWKVVWIFFMGTVLMRSAGCAMNDFADRDFDAHVARTRDRPLAAGRIKPVEALLVAAVLALVSFALVLQLNAQTIKLSVVALVIAAAYPFTKRFFSLPQAILGVAFGFGIPMAFAAQTTFVPWVGWVLLAANVFWAIAYDTEYAMVDRADDVKLGLRTSAITFGRYDVAAVIVSYVLFLSIMACVGRALHMAWPYHAGLAVASVLVVFQYRMIRNRDPQDCFRAFRHNNWIGAVIFAGTFAAFYLQKTL
ncbi:MAG: 4-hydroxybenzoate octaprenyltransferase [Betaproteobacteria bacterium]